ncbi:TPR domain protein [Lasiosphaeria hispida]|uniref:TPR domain protein n=1 Tax=Lasiosphaeria hispida TaxID=260671 RepID=A0AAJ0H5D1_9PEZI|nr:TPR domain protein [Lasiosphaeria hispida]
MDAHDVSEIPQFFEMLKKQKLNLRDAQSLKGQKPPPGKPRWKTILHFRLQAAGNAARDKNLYYMASSFVPPPYPPCVTSVQELSKVFIDDLVLETQHRGKYLLLRCVTPQDRMTAVLAIAEDEKGDIVLLQVYHQELAGQTPEDILLEGGVVIVKEPYFKTTSGGGYGLRVDHVSDIVFLLDNDKRIPEIWQRPSLRGDTATSWKTRGNASFNASRYRAAIAAYTRALDCSPMAEERQTIQLNRALAFLKAEAFDAALADVEPAATSSKPPEKALFRKAQALYGLQRFRECCDVITALRLAYPSNDAAKDLLGRAIGRLAEQTSGRYNFNNLRAEASRLRPPHLDRATYIGPVCIKPSGISPGGRGMFTTKAVAAGDLLLCEKAFAHSFIGDSDNAKPEETTILLDTGTDRITIGAQPALINMTIRKAYTNPSLAPAVTGLHHGTYQPLEADSVDGEPVVDSFLIRRIVALNSFGCPLTSRDEYLHAALEPLSPSKPKGAFHSCGVWPTASYINHSCDSNARRAFIGDMMVVRATRNLPADTELTFWYHPPSTDPLPYLERQRPLLRGWGFMCKCAMCHDLRDSPAAVVQKRRDLRAQFRALIPPLGGEDQAGRIPGRGAVKKAAAVVDTLNATYKRPAAQAPRWGVSDLQLSLARVYEQRMRPVESARQALASLESVGFVIDGGDLASPLAGAAVGGGAGAVVTAREWGLMVNHVIDCWMFLCNAYRCAGAAPAMAAAAEGYAKTSYRICFGEDETFEDTYGVCPR